jgi:hypothetical protein
MLQQLPRENKNRIVICELFHEFLHGKDNAKEMYGHYLVVDSFANIYEQEEESDSEPEPESESDSESDSYTEVSNVLDSDIDSEEEDNFSLLNLCLFLHREKYAELLQDPRFLSVRHKTIRNYHNIIRNPQFIQPHIAECFYLETNECVCVIKTFWLRLIQRTWKKIMQNKKDVLKKRKTISSLRYREIYGKWPPGLNSMPSIYGMLEYLN